ncbi:MAG: DUF5808 domain-containing protein [Corynebacterium sp.]|nr:DUF5808 domain-containing protein [Corynebacterium sp.]
MTITAILRTFEPENPALLVPRTIGLGWDLNLGAVAVKLGLIRPDDSLPDLATYIPHAIRRTLTIAPWVGAAGCLAAALPLAGKQHVARNFSLTGRPTGYGSGTLIAAIIAGVGIVPVALALRAAPTGDETPTQEETISVDVVAAAQSLGLETLALLLAIATRREHATPGQRQGLVPLAIAAAPIVSGGVLVGTVKAALDAIHHS